MGAGVPIRSPHHVARDLDVTAWVAAEAVEIARLIAGRTAVVPLIELIELHVRDSAEEVREIARARQEGGSLT